MKFFFLPFLLIACYLLPAISFAQARPEFRAVWVATVDNIDWPTKGNYNSDSQKVEFIKLLDMHQRNLGQPEGGDEAAEDDQGRPGRAHQQDPAIRHGQHGRNADGPEQDRQPAGGQARWPPVRRHHSHP